MFTKWEFHDKGEVYEVHRDDDGYEYLLSGEKHGEGKFIQRGSVRYIKGHLFYAVRLLDSLTVFGPRRPAIKWRPVDPEVYFVEDEE